jgi:hypothetical protein
MAVSVWPQLVPTIINFQSMPTKSKFLAKSEAAKPSAELN